MKVYKIEDSFVGKQYSGEYCFFDVISVALRGIFYIYNYHEVRQVFREQNGSGSVYKPISSPNDLISFINYIVSGDSEKK